MLSKRALAKMLTYQSVSWLCCSIAIMLVTGCTFGTAATGSLGLICMKMVLFYINEVIWEKNDWGRNANSG